MNKSEIKTIKTIVNNSGCEIIRCNDCIYKVDDDKDKGKDFMPVIPIKCKLLGGRSYNFTYGEMDKIYKSALHKLKLYEVMKIIKT